VGLLLVTFLAGCGSQHLDDTYGKRRGALGGSSVNGTAVLADMFEQAGHRVRTWRRLSPKLEECDVIVWAPDNFQPPKREQREFLENWLSNRNDRTLVYIGRDFDAAIHYWRKVRPSAPPEQLMEVNRRLATLQAEYDAERARIPKEEHFDWFTVQGDSPRKEIRSLKGPWSEGIDATQTEIQVAARLQRPSDEETDAWYKRDDYYWNGVPNYESLLSSGDDVDLVTRITISEWWGSRILVVVNGSFLLNTPLVNHEHRKLSSKLISACSPAGTTVFLESGPDGPVVFDKEPDANAPSGFEVLVKWPIGVIALHLIILGTTLCFALFPIFGRPTDRRDELRSDFGRHVDALGDLLESTQDDRYATDRVRHYHERIGTT